MARARFLCLLASRNVVLMHVVRALEQHVYALDRSRLHVKNYRPQCLVLCGDVTERRGLVQFCNQLRKGGGLMVYGNVRVSRDMDRKSPAMCTMLQESVATNLQNPLRAMGVKGVVSVVVARSVRDGAFSSMQYGLSRMRPNVVVLGFKESWRETPVRDLDEGYLGVIRDALSLSKGVVIIRGAHRVPIPSSTRTAGKRKNVRGRVGGRCSGVFVTNTPVRLCACSLPIMGAEESAERSRRLGRECAGCAC